MLTTTLNAIRKRKPCVEGWRKLLAHPATPTDRDQPFPVSHVLDSNGFDDCLWSLCCLPKNDQLLRKYVVWCVRKVEHRMTDPRSTAALDVAARYAAGRASRDELTAARAAAYRAQRVSESVSYVTRDAHEAAWHAARTSKYAAAAAAWSVRAAGASAKVISAKLRAILDAGKWVDWC